MTVLIHLEWVPGQELVSNDGVQQLGQTQRDVGIVVRVRVRASPLFKARQNIFNVAEIVLDVRKHCLRPRQDVSWGENRDGREEDETKASITGFNKTEICDINSKTER